MTRQLVVLQNDKSGILSRDLTSIETSVEVASLYKAEFEKSCRVLKGVGLAAPQLGVAENFFWVAPSVKLNGVQVGELCVRPSFKVIEGAIEVEDFEGCLSLPRLLFTVKRPAVIEACWFNLQNHKRVVKLKGFAARVFMREHDHLRGITLMESGVIAAKKQRHGKRS